MYTCAAACFIRGRGKSGNNLTAPFVHMELDSDRGISIGALWGNEDGGESIIAAIPASTWNAGEQDSGHDCIVMDCTALYLRFWVAAFNTPRASAVWGWF
jgi:hypothetical protein